MKNKKNNLDIVVDKAFCSYTFERALLLYMTKCRQQIQDTKTRNAVEYYLVRLDPTNPDSTDDDRELYAARLRELVDYALGRKTNIHISEYETYAYPTK